MIEAIPVVTPCIHPNGDRREILIARLEAAYTAVRAAMDMLQQCVPNARNFYPDPGRMEKYEAQHRARQDHLYAVYKSLEAEVVQMDREARA